MYIKGITDKLDLLPGLEATLGRQQPSEQDRKDAMELMLNLLNNLSCELYLVIINFRSLSIVLAYAQCSLFCSMSLEIEELGKSD